MHVNNSVLPSRYEQNIFPISMADLSPYAVPAASVGAAAIAAVAAYLAGRWKVREVELTYEQRIRDSYLENARKVAADVYVPLAVAISDLTRAYGEFRNRIDFDQSVAPQGSINRFKGACNNFTTLVADLLARGASAYLTLPLEEELTDFVLFLDLPYRPSVSLDGFTTSRIDTGGGAVFSGAASFARALGVMTSLTSPFIKIRLSVRDQIVSSPLPSREFERRFQVSTINISTLIKEVTLGSRTSPGR